MSRMMVMAGGTGGHVMPALAVARCLRERGVEVRWMGSVDGLEGRLVPADGFALDSIRIRGLRRSGLVRKLIMPFMLAMACFQALLILLRRRPDVLLGMGGFVSGPGGLMAGILGKPLVLHEQNAVAGMTNRWLSRIARRVLSGFPETEDLARSEWVGNPVRHDIVRLADPRERLHNRQGPLRILVVGGSQGARVFNEELPKLLPSRFSDQVIVHHQCGRGNAGEVEQAYQSSGIKAEVNEFIDDMAAAYDWSDIVICRAGAMTVAEICAAGAVAVFVPYPYAVSDHQSRNAQYLAENDAALSIPQTDFASGDWLDRLQEFAQNRASLTEMACRARALAKPDAAERVADICQELSRA